MQYKKQGIYFYPTKITKSDVFVTQHSSLGKKKSANKKSEILHKYKSHMTPAGLDQYVAGQSEPVSHVCMTIVNEMSYIRLSQKQMMDFHYRNAGGRIYECCCGAYDMSR